MVSSLLSLANIDYSHDKDAAMIRSVFSALLLFLTLCTPARAQEQYVNFFLRSYHAGSQALNNNTPGISYGQRTRFGSHDGEWFWEFGVFRNSYSETSPIALIGASWPVMRWRDDQIQLRAGAALGTAYYGQLSTALKSKYDIPNIDGFIPIAVASIALRTGRHELRLSTVPAADDCDYILNLSYTFAF